MFLRCGTSTAVGGGEEMSDHSNRPAGVENARCTSCNYRPQGGFVLAYRQVGTLAGQQGCSPGGGNAAHPPAVLLVRTAVLIKARLSSASGSPPSSSFAKQRSHKMRFEMGARSPGRQRQIDQAPDRGKRRKVQNREN